jgi:hypothetical protein
VAASITAPLQCPVGALAAVLCCVGCAASGSAPDPACPPVVGAGTAALAACGRRRHDGGQLGSLPASRSAAVDGSETVIIVNYVCPLGKAGVAWAMVINGVVRRVDQ